MRETKALPLDKSKNIIYNIALESIGSVNSFIDDNGHNHFESMIKNILKYIENDLIGVSEATQIYVNRERRVSKRAMVRNYFRKEMRLKLRQSLEDYLKDKEIQEFDTINNLLKTEL